MRSITREVADFVAEIGFDDLPEVVVHEAKRILLDSIGCAIGGLTTDKGRSSVEVARHWGGNESTIIGIGKKVSCAGAALANGELINALDYDVLLWPPSHITPYVLPASLALAESTGASGQDLIVAMAVSHEIATRLAIAMGTVARGGETATPPSLYGVCIVGSAAGAGKILGLQGEKLARALGLGSFFCPLPSRLKWSNTAPSSMTKYLSTGWVSLGGVTSALLAQSGYAGDPTALDGEYGFYKFYGYSQWRPEVLTQNLGRDWSFPDGLWYKRYPCCAVMHSGLHCFEKIIEENGLTAGDIDRVTVFRPQGGVDAVRGNKEMKTHIDAQFSIPYVYAAAAYRVKIGAAWQDPDTLTNPKILAFMDKVSVEHAPDFGISEGRRDMQIPCMVEVQAKGKTFREQKRYFTDMPEAQTTDEDLVRKFAENTSRVLSSDKIDKIATLVLEVERLENVAKLMKMVAL